MANRHFGKLGDIWKHLPLMEALLIEQPAHYLETHAGAAMYTPSACPQRESLGVFYFLRSAERAPALRESGFFKLLASLRGGDAELKRYPGSPAIAMHALARSSAHYVFCDTDGGSLDNVRQTAERVAVPRDRLELVNGDGIAAVHARLARWGDAQRGNAFVLIDPYDPAARSTDGITSIELFARLAGWGVRVMLWYGYHGRHRLALPQSHNAVRDEAWRKIESALAQVTGPHVWCGEVEHRDIDHRRFRPEADPGVLGCGIACANFSQTTTNAMRSLGSALTMASADARLPDGTSGTLSFIETSTISDS